MASISPVHAGSSPTGNNQFGRPTSGKAGHIGGLTGLRGIAAWWVVLFHFREFLPQTLPAWIGQTCAQGYLAVDLFFILSGFIIGYNYLTDFGILTYRQYFHFLGVRLARIYPLHIVMLALFLLNPLAILIGASRGIDSVRYDPVYFVLSIFLVQNWGFTHSLSWNIPAWSISTEWFAYLCFPFIAWVVDRIPRGFGPAVLGSVLPLAILAAGLWLTDETLGGDINRNGLFRCVTEFTAGIFLYRLWRQFGHSNTLKAFSALLSIGCGLLYCFTPVQDFWLIPTAWASLIISLSGGKRAFGTIFTNRIVERAGAWSYSTYLVHYFVRDWVKFLLVHDGTNPWLPLTCYLITTAAASGLLYRMVEVPGRRILRQQVDRFTLSLSLAS
jgi:peptidoglycan/LPS O-acetylase OafA/YrhL